MRMRRSFWVLAAMTLALAGMPALAQFDLSWNTIDGGGSMFTTSGGTFNLDGTIGQPDAGTMSGGTFTLTGGFWAVTGAGSAICRGDLNCDGVIDFGDINPFILALSNWPQWLQTYPDCPPQNADVNADGIYGGAQGFGDINPFISLLNSGGGNPIPCP